MSNPRACGFLIVRGNPIAEFLLMVHPDRLDLPKGHVNKGETDMECALRELREETGIRRSDIKIDADFHFEIKYEVRSKHTNFEPRKKTVVIFLAELIRDVEIELTEHDGFEWHAWNPPHQIQKNTIDSLLDHLEKHLTK